MFLWVCISHYIFTVTDVTKDCLLTIAAIMLTTKVGTSATAFTVMMVVVEVAVRWSA